MYTRSYSRLLLCLHFSVAVAAHAGGVIYLFTNLNFKTEMQVAPSESGGVVPLRAAMEMLCTNKIAGTRSIPVRKIKLDDQDIALVVTRHQLQEEMITKPVPLFESTVHDYIDENIWTFSSNRRSFGPLRELAGRDDYSDSIYPVETIHRIILKGRIDGEKPDGGQFSVTCGEIRRLETKFFLCEGGETYVMVVTYPLRRNILRLTPYGYDRTYGVASEDDRDYRVKLTLSYGGKELDTFEVNLLAPLIVGKDIDFSKM